VYASLTPAVAKKSANFVLISALIILAIALETSGISDTAVVILVIRSNNECEAFKL
jgi:hypothetical protein